MHRRSFLQYLCWLGLAQSIKTVSGSVSDDIYRLPEFGNVTLLHFTDSHAQLLPVYYRESCAFNGYNFNPKANISSLGQSKQFLNFFGIKAGTREAYAFANIDFVEAATLFGKMGGYAHLATLIKKIKLQRSHGQFLLLDGGDSWQGSGTTLWMQGQDMIAASNLLGVDMMTGHWEFTYGSQRVLENCKQFKGHFIAQNITLSEEVQFTSDLEKSAIFPPYRIKEFKSAKVAVIGQAFPYTPIAHPQRFTPEWRFGIQEQNLQQLIDYITNSHQADSIILLSHNGLDVDLKLASRVRGIDIILGGHTHEALPRAIPVTNASGKTWVTNAGSNGKFLGVLDMKFSRGKFRDFRYRLVPVFSNLIEPDLDMQNLINTIRAPYIQVLQQPLATTDRLLYRKDTFKGTFDELILDALLTINDAEIALSPGFRWGTTLLPGHTIRYEDVMNMTAITYPETYQRTLNGNQLKVILEDVADNLFNRDPYYRQGGDMVRVGGIRFVCDCNAEWGQRINKLQLNNGKKIEAKKAYKITGWASTAGISTGKTADAVVSEYLQSKIK